MRFGRRFTIGALLLLPLLGQIAAGWPASQLAAQSEIPRALDPIPRSRCYNGVGFFQTDRTDLDRRLPAGFVSSDGRIFGAAHAGHALLAMIYWSCPSQNGEAQRFAVLATPIEDPSVVADLRPVRFNWYEFARLIDRKDLVEQMNSLGFSAQEADFSNAPFHEGDRESTFAVTSGSRPIFQVTAALKDSINFQPQSHRFWHYRSDGRLVSTRFDFEYHHSWVGDFASCSFEAHALDVVDLSGIRCIGPGITEAIESLSFSEQILLWR